MRRTLLGGLVCLLLLPGCDQPDEVYKKLPKDYDPNEANGMNSAAHEVAGEKSWDYDNDGDTDDQGFESVEICVDEKVDEKIRWMAKQPIIPMVGAGGLDMTGGETWAGLTIDQAQSKEMLCQGTYVGDGYAYWGPQAELVAFFDTETRLIDAMMIRPGYEGDLIAGDFVLNLNEKPIMKGTVPLNAQDGKERDPRNPDNMRALDRALISTFRPGLSNPEDIDCVESGSCYVMNFGTVQVLVFMSVGMYISIEPFQFKVAQFEMSLKRPFKIGLGELQADGADLTVLGNQAAGIPSCRVQKGTTWKHVKDNCLAGDPMAMAQVQAAFFYEYIYVNMGGVTFFFNRPSLKSDEILPLQPELKDDDVVAGISVNAAYEGNFVIPFSPIIDRFKELLADAIRAEAWLPEDAPTGVESLIPPNDPLLPANIAEYYPDRLRPGGVYAVFCEKTTAEPAPADAGNDADTDDDPSPVSEEITYSCEPSSTGGYNNPMISTLMQKVQDAVGPAMTDKLGNSAFYVRQFLLAMGEYFNNDTPLDEDQYILMPRATRPDFIDATYHIESGGDRYTVALLYGGNEDRIHYLSVNNGLSRTEEVLIADAELPASIGEEAPGSFTFEHLINSPRLGLDEAASKIFAGRIDKVYVDTVKEDIRRAMLRFPMGVTGEEMTVLAPYRPASTVTGYYVPYQGPQDIFVQADAFSLGGAAFNATFYLVDAEDEEGNMHKNVAAIGSSSFMGRVPFGGGIPEVYQGICGPSMTTVGLGDFVDEILSNLYSHWCYPYFGSDLTVRYSENREFVTQLVDNTLGISLEVSDNQVTSVFAWSHE